MASDKNKSATGVNKAVIVNISSILGSITKNDQGGFYPYRTSKVMYDYYSIPTINCQWHVKTHIMVLCLVWYIYHHINCIVIKYLLL